MLLRTAVLQVPVSSNWAEKTAKQLKEAFAISSEETSSCTEFK